MPDLLSTITETLSGAELALVLGAVAMAGFIRGFLGFGSALIIIMVVSAVLGPREAVPIAGLAGLPVMLYLLPDAYRHAERAFVGPCVLAILIAAPIGTFVLVSLDPAIMKIAISSFVLFMAALMQRGWRWPGGTGRSLLFGVGAIAGLAQGAAGVGGPPLVALSLSRPGPPERQRANVIGTISALMICSLPVMGMHGLFTDRVIAVGALLVPLYVVTAWLGTRYFAGPGQERYQSAALMALIAIGVVTLALAVRSYVAAPV